MKKIKIFLFSFIFILAGVTMFAHDVYAANYISISSCSIPEGQTTCSVTLNWFAADTDGSAYITSSYPSAMSDVVYGNSGTTTYTIPKEGAGFYFKIVKPLHWEEILVPGTDRVDVVPTGGSFSSGTECVIAPMHSTCVPYLKWTVNNSFVTPAVTATINGVVNTQITTGISGPFDDSNHTLSYQQNRSYYLYHNGTQLDSVNVAAVCATSTHWNGHLCSPATLQITDSAGGGKINGCIIPVGGDSCTVDFEFKWTDNMVWWSSNQDGWVKFIKTINGVSTLVLATDSDGHYDCTTINITNGLIGKACISLKGITQAVINVEYKGYVLDSKTVASVCAINSAWDGTKCSSATFTVTPSCVIAPNQSTCPVNINFGLGVNLLNDLPNHKHTSDDVTSITTPTNISIPIVSSDNYNENCSGFLYTYACHPYINRTGSATYNIKDGITPFYFYNFFSTSSLTSAYGSYLMGTTSATATCTYGYTWDGVKCSLPLETFVVTPCKIQVDQGSCKATFAWNVRNPKDSSSTNVTFTTIYGTHSSTNVPAVIDGPSSGSQTFNLSESRTDNKANVVLNHDGKQLASYEGYASCVTGTMWNNSERKCLSIAAPIGGTISATPCSMIQYASNSTCQFTLSWSAWQKDESNVTVAPYIMPTIEIYHNGNYAGTMKTNTTVSTDPIGQGNEAVPGGYATFQYLFDEVNLNTDGNNYTSYNNGKYTLPDRDVAHYAHVYPYYTEAQGYSYPDNDLLYRNVTFKLIGAYDKKVTGSTNIDAVYEQNLCSNLGFSGEATWSGNVETYTCHYKPVLAETTVDAVCGQSGFTWSDYTNSCLPDCVLGYSYSGDPYQSSNDPATSYRCRPTTTPTVTVTLTKSSGEVIEVIPSCKDSNTGETYTCSPLPPGTTVNVGFTAGGFYNTDLQCKLLVDGVQQGTTWAKGLYDSGDSNKKPFTLKTSSSKFSVKCSDGVN